jgi:hypothetical protein
MTLLAALQDLRQNANRLCDRGLGGTYEADCRRSIAQADVAIAQAQRLDAMLALMVIVWRETAETEDPARATLWRACADEVAAVMRRASDNPPEG